jgi:hypothetical protein
VDEVPPAERDVIGVTDPRYLGSLSLLFRRLAQIPGMRGHLTPLSGRVGDRLGNGFPRRPEPITTQRGPGPDRLSTVAKRVT